MNTSPESSLPDIQSLLAGAGIGVSPPTTPTTTASAADSDSPPVNTTASLPEADAQTTKRRSKSAMLEAEIESLRAEIDRLKNAGKSDSTESLVTAIAKAMKPGDDGATKFNPLSAIPQSTLKDYDDFINSGLAPVANALVSHFQNELSEQARQLQERIKQQEELIKKMAEQVAEVPKVRSSALQSSVVAAIPNYLEITSSPEWEQFLEQRAPMLGGVTYGQVLARARQVLEPHEAVAAHIDAVNAFKAKTGAAGTQVSTTQQSSPASTLVRPQPAGAGVPKTNMPRNYAQEIKQVDAEIDKIIKKPFKTSDDKTSLDKLYEIRKALEVEAISRGIPLTAP